MFGRGCWHIGHRRRTRIRALLACPAGSAGFYVVEPDDVIELARQIAADNGFSNRIEFVQAMTTDIDLPEKVDGIVVDIRGRSPHKKVT